MSEDAIREITLATGLVDNKVCAIDRTWSGLRLVIRLQNRDEEGEADAKRSASAGIFGSS